MKRLVCLVVMFLSLDATSSETKNCIDLIGGYYDLHVGSEKTITGINSEGLKCEFKLNFNTEDEIQVMINKEAPFGESTLVRGVDSTMSTSEEEAKISIKTCKIERDDLVVTYSGRYTTGWRRTFRIQMNGSREFINLIHREGFGRSTKESCFFKKDEL